MYLPFFDNNNAPNIDEYLQCTYRINSLLNEIYNLNKEVILLGDLNADFSKENKNCKMICSLLKTHDMIPIDRYKLDGIATYTRKYLNQLTESWLDHICIKKELLKHVMEIRLLSLPNKKDDHKPLIIEYEVLLDNKQDTIHDHEYKLPSIDWASIVGATSIKCSCQQQH